MASSLRLHHEDGFVRLELFAPDGYPRLSASLLDALDTHLRRLLADRAYAGIVIHGSEKCFAAGADIREVGALSAAAALDFARRGQQLFERIASAPKPVVAAIAGHCLGGAFDLALACWARLAAPDARLGHPGPALGLLTGWGGTQRLPHLVGRAPALELLLLAEPLTADRALAIGLVDEVVAAGQLLPRAVERAAQMARLRAPSS